MNYNLEYKQQVENREFEIEYVKIRRKEVLKAISKFKPKSILEVGCGLDPLFTELQYFEEYFLVEPQSEFIKNAKLLIDGNEKFTFINDKIENVVSTFKNTKIDFISLSSLLHEVEEPDLILKSIYNISNSKTIVYIDVPNMYSFHRLLGVELGLIKKISSDTLMHKRFNRKNNFDKKKLERLVLKAGFKVINCFSFFIKPFSHSQMQLMLKNEIISDKTLEALGEIVKFFPDHGSSLAIILKK